MNQAETIAKKDLENKGWNVVNLEPGTFLIDRFETRDGKELANDLTRKLKKAKFHSGCPDLLCYKEKEDLELVFVEVKSKNDSVKLNQIKWFSRNDYNIKLAFVDNLTVDYYGIEVNKN
jgi:hypothetical protein